MISQYTKPQDTITLLLERVTQGVAHRSNPVVIAPQYLLSRRSSETLPTVAWTTQTTIVLSYDLDGVTTALPTTYVVDIAEITLWGDNLLLSLDEVTNRQWTSVDDRSDKLRTSGLVVISGTGKPATILRDIAVGDVLICSDAFSGPTRRRITALAGQASSTSLSAVAAGAYNAGATSYSAVLASTDFATTESILGTGSWTAFVTGAKIGTQAGDVFALTFSHATATADTATVTAVKASTGATITATATHVWQGYYSGDSAWYFTLLDPDTGNKIDVWLNNITAGENVSIDGFTATITIYSAYSAGTYALTATGAGSYTGLVSTRIVVEVAAGGRTAATATHSFRISDTMGRGSPQTVTGATTGGVIVTYLGLTITLPQAAYRKGDLFFLDVTASGESTTVFDGVVLDGPAYDTGLNPSGTSIVGRLGTAFSGEIPEAWCNGTSGWSLASNVLTFGGIDFTSGSLTDLQAISGYGTISAGYRAIVPVPDSETWLTIYNATEIVEKLGPVDMDNPVAYSASRAIGGTQGTPVYALRVGGLAEADFSAALVKISNTDMVYALTVAGTQATVVFTLLKTHCESQSVPTKKNFRRVYLGVDSPGEFLRVGADSLGATAKARILPNGGANTQLTFSVEDTDVDVDLVASGVKAGDIVKLYNGPNDGEGNATAIEYVIESLGNAEESGKTIQAVLVQQDPVIDAVITNTIAEVWAADNAENQIDYMVAVARSLGSRRAIVVWCEGGTTVVDGVSTAVSSEYIAAEIAGLRCALLPQEGITTYELTTVTSAPAMYSRYTEDQLNRAAANGVMVVCQEYPDGPVFIRHQLTTDTSNGLLAWEDSVGVNLDDQGFQVKDAFYGYRGRKNVTERTRKEVEDQLFQLVFNMTQAAPNLVVGPQITGFSDEDGNVNKVTVKFHPIYKDRLITFYRPGMPVPLNGIDHTIFGEVQDVI